MNRSKKRLQLLGIVRAHWNHLTYRTNKVGGSSALLPAIFEDLLLSIAQCVIPRTKYRDNPRVVCIKMSKVRLEQNRKAS